MSGNVIATYECSVLRTQGKRGELKKDDKGYFEFVLGAFDILNARGEFYPFTDQLKGLFASGSSLHRRIHGAPGRTGGNLKGEFDHPAIQPGQSLDSFIARWKHIQAGNIAVHIKSVRLEWSKDDKGRNIVLVYGMIKASGAKSSEVNEVFSNTEENAAMSGRFICDPVMVNGVRNKMITEIITWDFVNEPGIAVASKYSTPTMESLTGGEFTLDVLDKAERQTPVELSGESENDVTFTMIRNSLGWQKTPVMNLGKSTDW